MCNRAIKFTTIFVFLTSAAHAAFQGFNYGAENQRQSDFEDKFNIAKNLPGTNGRFTSARLYTMIQHDTIHDVISAIPAAIQTNTSLLLGLWASAGPAQFNNELIAFQEAIDKYGSQLQQLVVGISIGSEDLYRSSYIGQQNNARQGTDAAILVEYIRQVRDAIKNTVLKDIVVGHVDTWTAYVDESSVGLIDACDWLGVDAYPYFEHNISNAINEGQKVFRGAVDKIEQIAGGKPIWVTGTGWPTTGPVFGQAVASVQNTQHYYKTVGCSLNNTNTWWSTLRDSGASPNFGILDADDRPFFDLSCKNLPSNLPTSSIRVGKSTVSKVDSATKDSQAATTTAFQLYCAI